VREERSLFGRKVKRVTNRVIEKAAVARNLEVRRRRDFRMWEWRFIGADNDWHVLSITNWMALERITRGELPR
jgi:hypothetical protein